MNIDLDKAEEFANEILRSIRVLRALVPPSVNGHGSPEQHAVALLKELKQSQQVAATVPVSGWRKETEAKKGRPLGGGADQRQVVENAVSEVAARQGGRFRTRDILAVLPTASVWTIREVTNGMVEAGLVARHGTGSATVFQMREKARRPHRKRVAEDAPPAPEPTKSHHGKKRQIPYTVKSQEFAEGITQREAILKALARSDSGDLTTEQIAVALAEHGYPFHVSASSNITEPISTMLYKMKNDYREVKSRLTHQEAPGSNRKGKVRMALWSLAGKARLQAGKEG